MLGALAGETRDLLLGTGILPIASRTTMLTAMGAATVHERSGGRLVLGLGTGGLGRGALSRLREEVLALRALFEDGSVELGDQTLRLPFPAPAPPSPLGPLSPARLVYPFTP